MKTCHKVIISFAAIVAAILAASGPTWPSIIPRCDINDKNMDKCLTKVTQLALNKLAKGLPVIGLRSLDPLRNASFSIDTGSGPVNARLHTNNVLITGPSKVQLKKVSYNKRTSTYWFEGLHNLVKITGNYRVKGTILSFPIESSGIFDFELRGGLANHSVKIGNTVRDLGHGDIKFKLQSFKLMKLNLKDTTLGVGGSEAVNTLVNDNFDLISQVLWDPMEGVVRSLYSRALRPLMSKFNVHEFFASKATGRMEIVDPIPEANNDGVPAYSYTIEY